MSSVELQKSISRNVCLFCKHMRPSIISLSIRRSTPSKPQAFLSTSTSLRATATQDVLPVESQPLKITREGSGAGKGRRHGGGGDAQKSQRSLRIVPASPAYFSGKPAFIGHLLAVEALQRKYETLPTVAPIDAPRVAWKKLPELSGLVGAERVGPVQYHQLIDVLARLNRIHPALMPEEVIEAMKQYKRDFQPHLIKPKQGEVDPMGRAKGVGRRKTSSAVAWIVEGEGEVLINGKTLSQMFGRVHDRESAIWSLKSTDRIDKYNVFALVRGGGVTGQAEALTLAVAKALMVHEPALKPALRRAGCVTRDPRAVERKKPGHIKARKMPTWVKR